MCVHRDTAKNGCDHLDAVGKTWIDLEKCHLTIRAPRFVVDHTIEDAPVCDATSRVAAAMISELRVNAAANPYISLTVIGSQPTRAAIL
ncbi:hypothetical protein TNCV_1339891 [Trichonephila clavipes]|uniref:Uncharacterized protein n=1 Tax=Trichonephila clavipes TaxID=2585209 RepID=A0A8X6R864_TRICX|nr:hypothetical protein TNCV_1339891 [Trichonephila clavipes]